MSEPIITKTCRICKETKPISEFCKSTICKSGYYNWCKNCMRLYQREYARSKKRRTKMKEYLETPKGKKMMKQTYKRYNQTEKGKARMRRYDNQHPEKHKQYRQSACGKEVTRQGWIRYNLRHPERRLAKNAVNQAVRAGKLPRSDTLRCHYCPEKAEQYHHWSYLPGHWLDVIPVCKKCHILTRKKVAI